MKTINLNYKEIQNALYLLNGSSEKVVIRELNGSTSNKSVKGVFHFTGVSEGVKLRITKINKILLEHSKDYETRMKTIQDELFSKEEIAPLKEDEWKESKQEWNTYHDYLEEFNNTLLNSDKGKEFVKRSDELYNTSTEITFEPFNLSKVEDLKSDDGIDYSFVYDNFTISFTFST